MTVGAVFFAVAMFAIPTAFFSSLLLWRNEQYSFELQMDALAKVLNSSSRNIFREEIWLNNWHADATRPVGYLQIYEGNHTIAHVGSPLGFPHVDVSKALGDGSVLYAQRDATSVLRWIILANVLVIVGAAVLLAISYLLAKRAARVISAPMIFLAAQAEQLGSGQIRGRAQQSGIEEIDLVQAELARTSERMAARIAAERQFSRDVSHQVRTPLTALTLRLEELDYLNQDPELTPEIQGCLSQTERLAEVIEVLLKQSSKRGGGSGQSISILEIFSPLREEWEEVFARKQRTLAFQDDSQGNVMATPAVISQILATLLENSLAYGAGVTRVHAHGAKDGKAFIIDVSDEGEGVEDEIAEKIFEKGFSGRGSSGLGLGIAAELVAADGGSLTLYTRRPPTFRVSLQAAPSSLKEKGAFIVSGRRRSHLT
ncbi:hypothetical protein BSR29_06710 [Boudabousia liubingyangii]|uniref:histidine kinase n=2 Tax=Boudabousia liubingyangii TaxID=1921764 RepID=A0A1Q5PL47_9ACTO|nr:hypothetical protein BSR28_07570 [Boudabousia liubingyangii]OKL47331.1 hypothetical protein BSR29_06710 [Boudabousia liubingyangii]